LVHVQVLRFNKSKNKFCGNDALADRFLRHSEWLSSARQPYFFHNNAMALPDVTTESGHR